MITRCVGFDNNGIPTRGGCRRRSCKFIHPDDPLWQSAPPPSIYAPRRRSPPRRSPRRRTPSPRRRSTPTIPSSSSSSMMPPPSSMPPPPSTSMPPPSSMPPPPSTSNLPQPSHKLLPPPPTPPPSILPNKPIPQKSLDQLKPIWEHRIKILADHILLRKELTRVESDIANHRLLTHAFNYSAVPEDGKSNVNKELLQLERRRDEIKKQREDGMDKLMLADSWPGISLTAAELAELNKYNDILKNVAQLTDQVHSLNAIILKLQCGQDADDDAMQVDPQDPSLRPLKRRRGALSDPIDQPEPGPTIQELQDMRDNLVALETRFSTVLNDITTQDSDIRTEVNSMIDSAVEEFTEQLDTRAPLGEQIYQEAQQTTTQLGKDVGELADDVANLLLTVDAQKLEMEQIKEEIAVSRDQYAELQKQFQEIQESRERDRRTIFAMEQALDAYTSAPTQPPPPGLTFDQLVELLEEPLQDSVRTHIQPLIETLRNQVQEMLNTQNSAMYQTLWSKLTLTLRMVESISKRLERIGRTTTAPSTATPTSIVPVASSSSSTAAS